MFAFVCIILDNNDIFVDYPGRICHNVLELLVLDDLQLCTCFGF